MRRGSNPKAGSKRCSIGICLSIGGNTVSRRSAGPSENLISSVVEPGRHSGFIKSALGTDAGTGERAVGNGSNGSEIANSPPGSVSARHSQSESSGMDQYIHAATRHVPGTKGNSSDRRRL
jgi:hypothetical protein